MGDHDQRELPKTLAAFSIALCAEDDDAGGSWVELWPQADEGGRIRGRDGREFLAGTPQAIIAGSELPLLLDIDHESEFGFSTIASGWIEELEERNGGLWGRLEPTAKGSPLIADKLFRMLSPVIRLEFDGQDDDGNEQPGRAVGLQSVALTNRPNLRMRALNSAETAANATEEAMSEEELAELRALLGLEEGADGAMLLEAVKAVLGAGDGEDIEGDDTPPAPDNAENARLSAELDTMRASLSIVTEQRDKLAANAAEAKLGDAKARVDLAIREGRANPAHRATLEALAAGDDEKQALFSDLTSTVTGPPTGRVVPAKVPDVKGSLKARLSELTEAEHYTYQSLRSAGLSQERAFARLTKES